MLLGKNRTLRNEVDSHEPTVIGVVDLGLSMIEEGHPQSDEFQQQINELNSLWAELQTAVDDQKARIELSEVAQQVFTKTLYVHLANATFVTNELIFLCCQYLMLKRGI